MNKNIKKLKTNKGEECWLNPFNTFCKDHEIIHGITLTHSLKSNGVAKMKNMTLKDVMNAMLVSLGAPLNLWKLFSLHITFIRKLEELHISYARVVHLP